MKNTDFPHSCGIFLYMRNMEYLILQLIHYLNNKNRREKWKGMRKACNWNLYDKWNSLGKVSSHVFVHIFTVYNIAYPQFPKDTAVSWISA